MNFGVVIFGIVGVLVLAGIGVVVARWAMERYRNTIYGPYREGHPDYWSLMPFGKAFARHTLGGFRMGYSLDGIMRRIDNHEFVMSQMLDEERHESLIEIFNGDNVSALIQPRGPFFFVFSWFNEYIPGIAVYKAMTAGDTVEFDFDANGCDLVKAVNEKVENEKWKSHGCSIELLQLKKEIWREHIEANFAMLTREQFLSAEENKKYLLAEEMAVVAALKRRLDLAEREETHRQGDLRVTASVVDQVVKLEWEMSKDVRRQGFSVKGFRQEGGFSPNRYSESDNGTLIVDSDSNGTTADHPKTGSIQFYTFFLLRRPREGDMEWQDALRFQLRIPADSDVKVLKEALEQNARKQASLGQSSKQEVEIKEQFERLDDGVSRIVMSKDKRDELLKKIRSMNLQGTDEEELAKFVSEWYKTQVDTANFDTFQRS